MTAISPSYIAKVERHRLRFYSTRSDGLHVNVFHAVCDACGEIQKRNYRLRPDPDIVARQFGESGWSIGKANVCPACRRAKKEANAMLNGTHGVDFKHTRMVMQELEDRFDEKSGRYRKDDDSDEAVSRDVKLSVDFVKSIREKAFGPLKAPQEIQSLGEEIKALRDMLDSLQQKFTRITAKYST